MDTVLQTGLSNALVASALAFVAVLVGYFYRRPALVHGLWLLVLLKLVTPPLVTVPILWPATTLPPLAAPVDPPPSSDYALSSAAGVETVGIIGEQSADLVPADLPPEQADGQSTVPVECAAPAAAFPWQALIVFIWLAGSASWFLLAGWRVWRFRRLLRFAVPAPASLRLQAERLAHQMKLRVRPIVVLVPGRLAPMLWAAGGKPLLLVPGALLAHLTAEQQRTLLAHELAHLRRGDHCVRGLELLVRGLYWWHPVVWYACRELREAEEQCCDAWVVSLLPGAGKTYATALLETLDFLSDARPGTPLLASAVGHVSDLKRRLTMIMNASTPRSLSWRGTLALLSLGLLALPLLPTLVQAQTEEKQEQLEKLLTQLRVEVSKNEDAARVQTELAKAQAELVRLQLDLKMKQEQIKALEARLAAMKGGKKTEEANPGVLIVRLENGQMMKILLHDEALKMLLPGDKVPGKYLWKTGDEKMPTEIILRKVGDKWEVVQPTKLPQNPAAPKQPGLQIRVQGAEEKGGSWRVGPGPEANPTPPTPAARDRLEHLERQLQQITQELGALRKELNQPKPGEQPKPKSGSAAPIQFEFKDLKIEGLENQLRKAQEQPKNSAPKP